MINSYLDYEMTKSTSTPSLYTNITNNSYVKMNAGFIWSSFSLMYILNTDIYRKVSTYIPVQLRRENIEKKSCIILLLFVGRVSSNTELSIAQCT